jgi:hypothetical protein
LELHRKLDNQHISQTPWYGKHELPEYPVPVLEADIVDMRKIDAVKQAAREYKAQQAEAASGAEEKPVEDQQEVKG